MRKILKQFVWMLLLLLPGPLFAWHWNDLWRTADQQGTLLLKAGKAQEASEVFKDKAWKAVASYRAEDYEKAYQRFQKQKTSDGQYNAGNAAAHAGHYQEAIAAYDKAIALNPNNADAVTNREIVKKMVEKEKQQCNKGCSKNDSDHSQKNDKQNTDNQSKSDKRSSEQQKQTQNNAQQKNNDDNKLAQNNQQKDQRQASKQQQQQEQKQQEQQHQQEEQKQQAQQQQQQEQKQQAQQQQQQQEQKQQAQHQQQQQGQQQQQDKQKQQADNSETSKDTQTAKDNSSANDNPSGQWQAQDDSQKQLLRRLPDDPGGLLKQKFLRDYMHRHSSEVDEGGV